MLVTLGLISFLSGLFGFNNEQPKEPETFPHVLEENILEEDVLYEDILVEETITWDNNKNIKYWDD